MKSLRELLNNIFNHKTYQNIHTQLSTDKLRNKQTVEIFATLCIDYLKSMHEESNTIDVDDLKRQARELADRIRKSSDQDFIKNAKIKLQRLLKQING
jgi:hypothetical protein